MTLFHTHYFQPLGENNDKLYCAGCGEVREAKSTVNVRLNDDWKLKQIHTLAKELVEEMERLIKLGDYPLTTGN